MGDGLVVYSGADFDFKTTLVGYTLSLASGVAAAHSRFNNAIGVCHAVEVFEHLPILLCVSFVRESAVQLLVIVLDSPIVGLDSIARVAFVQGLLEIVSCIGQSFCILADPSPGIVIASISHLGRETAARVIEPGCRCAQ
jgi:hypothetical protein